MSVEVITNGNRDLIQRFGCIIFLACESAQLPAYNQKETLTDVFDDQQREKVRVEVRNIFNTPVTGRLWKAEDYKDLNLRNHVRW